MTATRIFRHPHGRGKWLPQMDAFLRFHKLPTWTRDDASALLKKLSAKETSRGFVENYLAAPSEKALARQKSAARTCLRHSACVRRTRRAKSAIERCESAASRARP